MLFILLKLQKNLIYIKLNTVVNVSYISKGGNKFNKNIADESMSLTCTCSIVNFDLLKVVFQTIEMKIKVVWREHQQKRAYFGAMMNYMRFVGNPTY